MRDAKASGSNSGLRCAFIPQSRGSCDDNLAKSASITTVWTLTRRRLPFRLEVSFPGIFERRPRNLHMVNLGASAIETFPVINERECPPHTLEAVLVSSRPPRTRSARSSEMRITSGRQLTRSKSLSALQCADLAMITARRSKARSFDSGEHRMDMHVMAAIALHDRYRLALALFSPCSRPKQ